MSKETEGSGMAATLRPQSGNVAPRIDMSPTSTTPESESFEGYLVMPGGQWPLAVNRYSTT